MSVKLKQYNIVQIEIEIEIEIVQIEIVNLFNIPSLVGTTWQLKIWNSVKFFVGKK